MKYFILNYNRSSRGESGESCNSDYDLSKACAKCGTGAELVGSLKVRRISDVKKDLFKTLDGDHLISSELFSRIKQRIPDFELVQTASTKHETRDYYHLTTTLVLPKFSLQLNGFTIEGQCRYCRRNGYFNQAIIGDLKMDIPTFVSPLNLIYNEEDFAKLKMPLLVKSWECMGLSNLTAFDKYVIRYARPLLLLSETLKMALEEERVRWIGFDEVTILPAAAHNNGYLQ